MESPNVSFLRDNYLLFASSPILILLLFQLSLYIISNYKQVQINPENLFIDILKKGHMNYVTSRDIYSYLYHLFPELNSTNDLIILLKKKRFLDIGSGLNHLNKDSLLYKLNKKGSKWAKGIEISKFNKNKSYIHESLYNTKLPDNYIDMIVSHYVLYSHIYDILKLKKTLKETYRILKRTGEIRIYPVYFGNYYLGNNKFKKWINKHFTVKLINPKYYCDKNKILCNYPCNEKFEIYSDKHIMEIIRHYVLNVKTVIFIKK